MSFANNPIPPVANDIIQAQKSQLAENLIQKSAVQVSMQNTFEECIDQFSTNTMQRIRRDSETLDEKVKKRVRSESPSKQDADDETPFEIEATGEVSDYYENNNPEIKGKSLQNLKEQISSSDTQEDILQKVLENFPDPVIADAAFEYLLRTLPDELKEKVFNAHTSFQKRFDKALRAGKNIFDASLQFGEEGLALPSELRETYAELTSQPKTTLDIFEELLKKFTFEKMKQAIAFWLSALGSDLSSKGSSIEKGELHKLIMETRTLQAILGVYRFFASKQRELVLNLARKNQTATPEMNYQNLAKLFVKILQDKYPSPDKILFLKHDLHIALQLLAQEAIFSIMCSAVKNVAPRLYRNEKHREEVLGCFLTALEAIENVLEQ